MGRFGFFGSNRQNYLSDVLTALKNCVRRLGLGDGQHGKDSGTNLAALNLGPDILHQLVKQLCLEGGRLAAQRRADEADVLHKHGAHIDGGNIARKGSDHDPLAHVSNVGEALTNLLAAKAVNGKVQQIFMKLWQSAVELFTGRTVTYPD